MKKLLVILGVFLISVLTNSARADVALYSGLLQYSCASVNAGFNLVSQQNSYRLTGPIYVPTPGYSYTVGAVTFNTAPSDGEANLTLIAPTNINQNELPRLAVVPPLLVDYTFSSSVPVHKLTIFISNPVNRFDTKITCLTTGSTQ